MKKGNKGHTIYFALCSIMIFFLLKIIYAGQEAAVEVMRPMYGYFLAYVAIGLLLFAEGYVVRQLRPKVCFALSLFWILVIVILFACVLVFKILPYDGLFLSVFMDISNFMIVSFYLGTAGVSAINWRKQT